MRNTRLIALLLTILLLAGCRGRTVPNEAAGTVPAQETEDSYEMKTELIYGCKATPLQQIGNETYLEIYRKALADGQKAGYIPVFVYESDRLDFLFDDIFSSEGGQDKFAASVLSGNYDNGKERLAAMYQELKSAYGRDCLEIHDEDIDDYFRQPEHYLLGNSDFPSFMSNYGTPHLLQVPVEHPWEIFAWLPNCGWNTCPNVDDMIAVCRYWYEQYGAIPAMMSYDTLIFYLDAPITDRETAKALALEQTVFCDGIFEDEGPVSYAALMLNCNFWYFWWD